MSCQGKLRPTNPSESLATISNLHKNSFAFKSRAHEVFMETRPKVVVPIPLDMPGGCGNLNYSLYRPQLFTSSNVYLNCPIWQIPGSLENIGPTGITSSQGPLEPVIRTLNDEYRESRLEYFDSAYRIIREDMRDMNK